MKQKKREELAEIILRLGRAKAYTPEDLGVEMFRRTGTDERSATVRCILVSTKLRDRLMQLLARRL
jgi:hypothetical protein